MHMLMHCCVLAAAAAGPVCVLVRACGVVCARDACVRARVSVCRGRWGVCYRYRLF